MGLKGKGFMIWQIPNCEGGSASAIAKAAHDAGLTYVLIKIADGSLPYNVDKKTKADLIAPVARALRSKNIKVWGWHYVYGYDPLGEAKIAIKQIREFSLDGYVIDAEGEYKLPGRDVAANKFMKELRANLPNLPVALCSYRFPSLHPQLPWKQFLDKCNYNMPQVYWEQAHNPDPQLRRCVREFQGMTPYRTIVPTGPVYKWNGWAPTVADIVTFMNTCKALNIASYNFFAWDYGRRYLKPLWDAIAGHTTPPYKPTGDVQDQFVSALNTHNLDKILAFYSPDAIHITASETIQGTTAIRSWYHKFIVHTLPKGKFSITSADGSGNSRHYTWTGKSTHVKVTNGDDTLGLTNGKITYHYSSFTTKSV